jgi:hypothetical protein
MEFYRFKLSFFRNYTMPFWFGSGMRRRFIYDVILYHVMFNFSFVVDICV